MHTIPCGQTSTMETNTQSKRYGTILVSVLILGILAAGTFLSTEQFYTQVSLTQGQHDTLQKTSRGKYTVNELNNIHKKNEDKDRDVPITDELFEGANNHLDTHVDDAKNEDKDRDLPITDELFEGSNNDNDVSSGDGEDEISIGKVIEESISSDNDDEVDENEVSNDETDDDLYSIAKHISESDDDNIYDKVLESIHESIQKNNTSATTIPISPACHPHFNLALPNNRWSNTTKFNRIYFYHSRKAAGSTVHKYLRKVADKYGIELKAVEWRGMEEPGTSLENNNTFYVTNIREPISRSISHFKYQGRWDCHDLVFASRKNFVPTEENANSLLTWNRTAGHEPSKCKFKGRKKKGGKTMYFHLGNCAVNCYTQWWSGICKQMNFTLDQQYDLALRKANKFNFLFVVEKFKDPAYIEAVERFFNVSWNADEERSSPFCEKQSHKANEQYPLVIRNDTRASLTNLNEVDIKLYHRLTDCLDSGKYNFPNFDKKRWDMNTFNFTEAKARAKAAKMAKLNKS